MDQAKIGAFLKELRKENNLSQEQLAERLNVSSRSVSRWENGNTMPDISIIIELADYYDVDIRDLLNGERKSEKMNTELKETLEMVAEYTNAEKEKIMKELQTKVAASAVFFFLLVIIQAFQLNRIHSAFESFSIFCGTVGFVYSVSGVINLLQIKGRVDKNFYKKFKIGTLIIGLLLLVLSVVMLLWAIGVI